MTNQTCVEVSRDADQVQPAAESPWFLFYSTLLYSTLFQKSIKGLCQVFDGGRESERDKDRETGAVVN